MSSYKYRFPASGKAKDIPELIQTLETRLEDSPDCLGAWCMFPTDSVTLDRVTIDTDNDNNVNAVILHTYTELWAGREDDLRSCMEENLAAITSDIKIESNATLLNRNRNEEIPTYKYRFPAAGKTDMLSPFTATMLEEHLKDSPDCLMAYCIAPSDSEILKDVTFEFDTNDNVTAINLRTYTQFYEGTENELRNCVETNLAKVTSDLKITGDVNHLGLEGNIPETLYHIAERNDLDAIMKEGLVPRQGSNAYKVVVDETFLTSEHDLAPWLAVLKHKDNPVILGVKTEGLAIEPGRVFNDRDFIRDGYAEYRTKECIPSSSINEAELDTEFCKKLQWKMTQMQQLATSNSDMAEVATGMKRLKDMGIIPDDAPDDTQEDDFTKAIEEMENYQMNFGDVL